MSRRFTTAIRAGCIIALLLGMVGFLTPQAAAATPGGMFGWGSDENGTLCLGTLTTRKTTPAAAIGAASSDVIAVAAGGYYTLLLKANGTIFGCGSNRFYGTLGIGTEDSNNHPTPEQVVGVTGATAIAAGRNHSLAVAGGNVYAWGQNASGELGQGTNDSLAHPTPTVITGLSNVKAVAGGFGFSFAIKTDSTLWSWGANNAGQLGRTASGTPSAPLQVFLSPGVPLLAQSVAGGERHTAVVATDGKVYTFGGNGEGEGGLGVASDSLPHPTPTQVATLGANNAAVVAGYRHFLVLKSDGTAWGWGDDNIGQLGRGAATTVGCACQPSPAAVAGLTGAVMLGSSQQTGSALLGDGTVRTWGRGPGGELGNGGSSNSASPVQVTGLTNVVAISNGVYAQHNLAIKTTPGTAIVSVSPLAVQFPNQLVNTASTSQLVRLSNSGTQALVVSAITVVGANPGDFAQTNDCSAPVAPTAFCTITVTFTPTAIGARAATLRIADNAGDSPQQVALGGTGVVSQPPFNLVVTFVGAGSGTVGVAATNLTQPTPNHYVIPQVAVATLTAGASDSVFTGWKLDGVFVGWANPLTLTMNTDHTMEATFVPVPIFGDVPGGKAYTDPVLHLAARDIIRGCDQLATPRLYCPADLTARAQMAALIARASGWDAEDHATAFPDRCDAGGGCIDDALWRNVGTVAFYNVARGYLGGTYDPFGDVLHAQTISFITRAMITKGYWNLQPVDGSYTNVPGTSGHRQDIATFVHYAGALPDYPNLSGNFANWDQASTRAWFARTLWQALNSYWSVDRVP